MATLNAPRCPRQPAGSCDTAQDPVSQAAHDPVTEATRLPVSQAARDPVTQAARYPGTGTGRPPQRRTLSLSPGAAAFESTLFNFLI